MKRKRFSALFAIAVLVLVTGTGTGSLRAQTGIPAADPTETTGFAAENAILDTSIPFAIGAREAQQELRGAFGWATFQEGLVSGVYFRFDPDGYARFAPTPRLDEDVFEVICRRRTLSCMGRKQALSVMLNTRGQLELKIDDVQPGDTFFISEGVSEIQVPDRILQPLDYALETLLASGGDLVVRRSDKETARLSLKGLGPVSAYLRWIVARQDYSVLPHDWPVPNSRNAPDPTSLTDPAGWTSPMSLPQTTLLPAALSVAAPSADVAQMRDELDTLRNLLVQRSIAPGHYPPQPPVLVADPATTQLQDIQATIIRLEQQLMRPRETAPAIAPPDTAPATAALPVTPPDYPDPPATQNDPAPPNDMARQLSYLITEIGLDPRTAVMLLQLKNDPAAQTNPKSISLPTADSIVNDIMTELEQETRTHQNNQIKPTDYAILSDYFKDVINIAKTAE